MGQWIGRTEAMAVPIAATAVLLMKGFALLQRCRRGHRSLMSFFYWPANRRLPLQLEFCVLPQAYTDRVQRKAD